MLREDVDSNHAAIVFMLSYFIFLLSIRSLQILWGTNINFTSKHILKAKRSYLAKLAVFNFRLYQEVAKSIIYCIKRWPKVSSMDGFIFARGAS